MGKKGAEFYHLQPALAIYHDEINVAGEVEQDLSACSAGWSKGGVVGNDGDCPKTPFTFGDRFEDRVALRADR